MDKQILDNIFEPFFTNKDVGKGTGLGLATVYGIVKQNEGFITAYSEPGQGSTFKILLPRHASQVSGQKRPATDITPQSRGETILLVENDAAILKLSLRMLEDLGYTVIATSGPVNALERVQTRGKTIDLLVTDVVIPEMNDRDLAIQMQSHYPDLKALFMSGYTADVIAHRGVLDSGVFFMSKPFTKQELAAKIRDALESAGA